MTLGRVFLVVGMALLSLATPLVALADQTQGPGYGHHMWNGGWFLGPIMMILVVAAVVAAVVLVVRWHGGGVQSTAPYAPSRRTPMDILKDRFAKGEIDKDEFEERRQVLGG